MRTLFYIPMLHRMGECRSYLPYNQAENNSPLNIFLDRYWEYVNREVFNLVKKRHTHSKSAVDLDLFSEAWWTASNLRTFKRRMDSDEFWQTDGHHTIFAVFAEHGARLRITEGLTYMLEGIVHTFLPPRKERWYDHILTDTRDKAIAANLNRYVRDGSKAVLCLGAGHDVPAFLDASWEIIVVTVEEMLMLVPASRRWVELYLAQGAPHRLMSEE